MHSADAGFVTVNSYAASRQPATPVPWKCYHYASADTDEHGDYWIALDRLADEDDWADHLSRKDWIGFTDLTTSPIPALAGFAGGSVTNVPPLPGPHPAPDSSTDRPARLQSDDEPPTTT